jgi:hypothetical protein
MTIKRYAGDTGNLLSSNDIELEHYFGAGAWALSHDGRFLATASRVVDTGTTWTQNADNLLIVTDTRTGRQMAHFVFQPDQTKLFSDVRWIKDFGIEATSLFVVRVPLPWLELSGESLRYEVCRKRLPNQQIREFGRAELRDSALAGSAPPAVCKGVGE